jgi:hypothetical protein
MVGPLVEQQVHGAHLLEDDRLRGDHLLGQPAHDLDARQVALVNGAVEGLAGKRFLVHRPVRVAVEEAARPVFQLQHAPGRLRHQHPRQFLIVDPLSTL